MPHTFFSAFALTLSLIFVIGSQNSFILRQGIRKQKVFLVCTICSLSDLTLIALGIGGFHLLIAEHPWIADTARYAGAFFLFIYGALSLYSSIKKSQSLSAYEGKETSLLSTVLTCLALTWLNPHVYLDTLFLIGSVSTQFDMKLIFFLGAGAASILFFFMLGYGALLLAPLFRMPLSWKLLDAAVGLLMWFIAASLLY